MFSETLAQFLAAEPTPSALLRRLREHFVLHAQRMQPAELLDFQEIAIETLPKCSMLDRVAFSRAVAPSPKLPQRLVSRLLADSQMVAMPILESSPQCSDEDLIEMALKASEATLLSLASRPALSQLFAGHLFTMGNDWIRRALAENIEADLGYDILSALIDEAATSPHMDASLSQRPDLPPELAAKLYKIMSNRTAKRMDDMLKRDLMASQPKVRVLKYESRARSL